MSAKIIQISKSPPKTRSMIANGVILAESAGASLERLRMCMFDVVGRARRKPRENEDAGYAVIAAMSRVDMVYAVVLVSECCGNAVERELTSRTTRLRETRVKLFMTLDRERCRAELETWMRTVASKIRCGTCISRAD
jgi:hypothetical protein